jgi:hypothetical protein
VKLLFSTGRLSRLPADFLGDQTWQLGSFLLSDLAYLPTAFPFPSFQTFLYQPNRLITYSSLSFLLQPPITLFSVLFSRYQPTLFNIHHNNRTLTITNN